MSLIDVYCTQECRIVGTLQIDGKRPQLLTELYLRASYQAAESRYRLIPGTIRAGSVWRCPHCHGPISLRGAVRRSGSDLSAEANARRAAAIADDLRKVRPSECVRSDPSVDPIIVGGTVVVEDQR